eukprot:256219_1
MEMWEKRKHVGILIGLRGYQSSFKSLHSGLKHIVDTIQKNGKSIRVPKTIHVLIHQFLDAVGSLQRLVFRYSFPQNFPEIADTFYHPCAVYNINFADRRRLILIHVYMVIISAIGIKDKMGRELLSAFEY